MALPPSVLPDRRESCFLRSAARWLRTELTSWRNSISDSVGILGKVFGSGHFRISS